MLPSPTLVRTGPLTAVFERVGLRWISHGGTEVLRGIYGAVRDAHWRTIPADVSGVGIDQHDEGFSIAFEARHRDRQVDFVWHGRIEALTSGVLSFSMDGEARASFARNRIGLCVLHPLAGWIDRFALVEQADGAPDEVIFPKDVAPHQVMRGIRAIRNEVAPGLIADLHFEGEVFETEDQRNWSDASFKTYGTPVDLPKPVMVEAGTRIAQRVTLHVHATETPAATNGEAEAANGSASADTSHNAPHRKIWLLATTGASPYTRVESSEPVQLELTVETRPLPRVGVALRRAACSQTPIVRTRVASLLAAHLHVTLDTGEAGWALDLEQAAAEAEHLRLPLEVAVLASTANVDEELDTLARLTLRLGPPLARWLVFDRATLTTPGALATLARLHLRPLAPNAPIGGGSYGHFAELNRHRPPTDALDCLSYGLTPQAHDVDEATMMENVTSVGDVHRTIRRFAPGRSIVVSPVTLQPRPIDHEDPRMASSFAAAWMVAHLAALVEHGAEAVTYFDTVGPAGVIDAATATLRPVGQVLATVGAFRGASARLVRTSAPDAVAAFGLTDGRRAQVLVANLRAAPTEIIMPGERIPVRLAAHGILQRDLGRSLAAR
jgi:D-apionolactonase